MNRLAKWFPSATMMAFFAVLALLVSPVLALGCCCSSAPPVPSVVIEAPAKAEHHCHPKAAKTEVQGENCAVLSAVCDCETGAMRADWVARDSGCFAAMAAILAARNYQFAVPHRLHQSAVFLLEIGARPRGPDLSSAAGRAPPVLAPG